jgi:hypothetical protein
MQGMVIPPTVVASHRWMGWSRDVLAKLSRLSRIHTQQGDQPARGRLGAVHLRVPCVVIDELSFMHGEGRCLPWNRLIFSLDNNNEDR